MHRARVTSKNLAMTITVHKSLQVFLKDFQIGLEQLQGALGLRCLRASLPLGRAIRAIPMTLSAWRSKQD
jgi:hypothetical protein